MPRAKRLSFAIAACVAGAGCSSAEVGAANAGGSGGGSLEDDRFDVPIEGISSDLVSRFEAGDALFSLPFRDADGLGPYYIRPSCTSCHEEATRGPGLVQKMAVVLPDGVTSAPDQSKLPFGHTIRPFLTAGAKTPLAPPPNDPTVLVTTRVGPPLLGHGYMEAIDDAEIQKAYDTQKALGGHIQGRINRVEYPSEPNPDTSVHQHKKGDVLIGRFGLKARNATIDDFIAGALLGDIGITSPLRPVELPNPDALVDDVKPGVDVPADIVNGLATYVRLQAIPHRNGLTQRGVDLFRQVGCATCHVPSMKTRADYPIPELAGVDAPVYTDFLLHDMGTDLADGMTGEDEQATSRDWRTGALIGLRFSKTFMHDGRAHSVDEAIVLHGGPGSEAAPCIQLYIELTPDDHDELRRFVGAL